MTDLNATLEQHFLDGSQAEVEAIHQPEGVMNHGCREAIPSVSSGIG